jgi:hypothetical protein
MKILKLIFVMILFLTLNSTVFALNLDVDNNLKSFANQSLLDISDIKDLKNPFFIQKKIENDGSQNSLDLGLNLPQKEEFNLIKDNIKQQVDEQNNNYNPPIKINGILRTSNSNLALLLNYQSQSEIIKIGESMDNYKLINYQDGEATFINQGKKLKVKY